MVTRIPVTIDDETELDSGGRGEQPGGNTKSERDIPTVAGFELHSPSEFIDGGTNTGDSPGGNGRRRGRPRGSKNSTTGGKTETKAVHNLADGIEKLLLSVHAMGSVFLHCPELELDPMEAKIMASSIKDLSRHYQVTIDPKRLAMIEFSTVLASIYGLRGVAIYRRLKKEKGKPQAVPTPIREQPKAATGTAPGNSPAHGPSKPQEQRLPVPSDLWGAENGVEDLSQL